MRFSSELVLVKVFNFLPQSHVLTDLLHLLAERQINLSFLSLDCSLEAHASFCLAKKDFAIAGKVIDDFWGPQKIHFEYITSVGTLALFPHQSRIEVLALMLSIFGKHNIPIYGMSSSLSALAINIDYLSLDKAADLLQHVFQLPGEHTPFRQHLPDSIEKREKATCQKRPVVETAASYWEAVVRIYGSSIKTDLEMVTLHFPADRLERLANQLQHLNDSSVRFDLFVVHQVDGQTLQAVLLYGGDQSKLLNESLAEVARNCGSSLNISSHVELLYLHGPHFQDRFGVADAALRTLKTHHMEVLVSGCTGTSIYLVLPERKAQATAKVLNNVFSVPVFNSTSKEIAVDKPLL